MVYIPPSQVATKKPRPRSSAPKTGKYKNKKIEFRGMSFDSIGERDRYVFLLSEQDAGNIRNLQRQVKYPLEINGEHICFYVADFVYEKFTGATVKMSGMFGEQKYTTATEHFEKVVEDFKGVLTDVFKIKAKMFKACYGFDITITRRPSWRSSNAMEGKSWKHS